MYSIHDYGEMVSDQLRTEAYARALERLVGPDSVVLDLGTGTGILSLLACRYGARRIFAVEPSDAIEVAREMARANGVESRIEFFHALSTEIDLPERADVVVCDLHGMLPLFQRSVPTIIDARQRHLKPAGVLIPAVESVSAAPVSAKEQYASLTSARQREEHDIDFSPANRLVLSSFYRARSTARDLVAPPAILGTLDYARVNESSFVGSASYVAERDAVAHGWVAWFDSKFAEGVEISNAPGLPPLIFGQAFFPWPEPVALRAGDRVSLRLRAFLVGDNYLWAWDSDVPGRAFRQSELDAEVLSAGALRRQAASFAPGLPVEGRIDRLVLHLMSAGNTLGEIATALAREFPEEFPRWELALTRATQVSNRYGP